MGSDSSSGQVVESSPFSIDEIEHEREAIQRGELVVAPSLADLADWIQRPVPVPAGLGIIRVETRGQSVRFWMSDGTVETIQLPDGDPSGLTPEDVHRVLDTRPNCNTIEEFADAAGVAPVRVESICEHQGNGNFDVDVRMSDGNVYPVRYGVPVRLKDGTIMRLTGSR